MVVKPETGALGDRRPLAPPDYKGAFRLLYSDIEDFVKLGALRNPFDSARELAEHRLEQFRTLMNQAMSSPEPLSPEDWQDAMWAWKEHLETEVAAGEAREAALQHEVERLIRAQDAVAEETLRCVRERDEWQRTAGEYHRRMDAATLRANGAETDRENFKNRLHDCRMQREGHMENYLSAAARADVAEAAIVSLQAERDIWHTRFRQAAQDQAEARELLQDAQGRIRDWEPLKLAFQRRIDFECDRTVQMQKQLTDLQVKLQAITQEMRGYLTQFSNPFVLKWLMALEAGGKKE